MATKERRFKYNDGSIRTNTGGLGGKVVGKTVADPYSTTGGTRTQIDDTSPTQRVQQKQTTSTASPELTALANAPVNQTKTNVPVATLETPAKPLDIPTTPVTQVDATGAVGVAQTYLNEQQKALETAQTPVSDSEARIKELMGLRSKEAETKKSLEKQAGIQGKTDAYNKIISNIQRQTAGIQGFDDDAFYGIEEQRLDASKRDITKGVFGAKEQQMNLQNAIARRAKVSDLQGSLASASLLQGDLESAREQIKSSLAAIYDPIKQDIQDEMFFLQRADTRLSAAQKEQSDAKKLVLQSQMDSIANAEKLVSDAVISGGATPEEVKQMQQLSGDPVAQSNYAQAILGRVAVQQRNDTIATQRASRYASSLSARSSLMDLAIKGDTQAISELGFDPRNTVSGEYGSVIDTASLLVGAERGKQTRTGMANAVESGDYQTAYSMIANNVQSSLQGDSASRFGNARADIQVLGGLRDTIKEYEDAGGNTGFLKGSADEIARKFGQLKTDPKFATLAVQLEREFQAYRQQMTGAAFSAGESADYEKVNPSSKKSLELNSATIDGAIKQLENRVVGTVEAYVPGSRDIYSLATGAEKALPSLDLTQEPIGAVVEIGGRKYRKVGEDAYEEI